MSMTLPLATATAVAVMAELQKPQAAHLAAGSTAGAGAGPPLIRATVEGTCTPPTPALLHSCTPARLHACTPERLHACTLHACTPARLRSFSTAMLVRWPIMFGVT